MAIPALMPEAENPVEERVARLETTVEHIRSDVADIKVDLRRLSDKIDGGDQKLTGKIDALDQKLTGKIDALDQKLTGKIDALDQKLTDKIDAVDQKLTDKIDAVDQKLTDKIDAVDQKLTGKIDSLDQKLIAKIEGVDQKQTTRSDSLLDAITKLTLRVEMGFEEAKTARAYDRVWWLLICAAMLGVMAHGFKWI